MNLEVVILENKKIENISTAVLSAEKLYCDRKKEGMVWYIVTRLKKKKKHSAKQSDPPLQWKVITSI